MSAAGKGIQVSFHYYYWFIWHQKVEQTVYQFDNNKKNACLFTDLLAFRMTTEKKSNFPCIHFFHDQVTFARMMEMVKTDMTSSENDTSASEEPSKYIEVVDESTASNPRNVHNKRKQRSWNSRHFWRSNNSNSTTQGSASDQDIQDNFLLTDQTPSNDSVNGVGIGKSTRHLRLPSRSVVTGSRQASSTESLLNIIRNFSAANHRTPSTPSSPQMSDYELSSSFPTPLSTPGTPAGSLEVIPPTSNSVDSTSIQVSV